MNRSQLQSSELRRIFSFDKRYSEDIGRHKLVYPKTDNFYSNCMRRNDFFFSRFKHPSHQNTKDVEFTTLKEYNYFIYIKIQINENIVCSSKSSPFNLQPFIIPHHSAHLYRYQLWSRQNRLNSRITSTPHCT